MTDIIISSNTRYTETKTHLGKGGFGIVYSGYFKTKGGNEIECAVKVIRKTIKRKNGEEENKYCTRELENNRKIKQMIEEEKAKGKLQVYLLEIFEVIEDKNCGYIVMQKGLETIDQYAFKQFDGSLRMDQALTLFYHSCEGISMLHRQDSIHRDIKPDNMMLVNILDSVINTLIDFGSVANNLKHYTSQIGTHSYMAPERFRSQNNDQTKEISKQPYDTKSDIWSLGVVFHTLITGKVLFPGDNYDRLRQNIQNFGSYIDRWHKSQLCKNYVPNNGINKQKMHFLNYYRSWLKVAHLGLAELIDSMLQFDPLKRPTIQKVSEQIYKLLIDNASENSIYDSQLQFLDYQKKQYEQEIQNIIVLKNQYLPMKSLNQQEFLEYLRKTNKIFLEKCHEDQPQIKQEESESQKMEEEISEEKKQKKSDLLINNSYSLEFNNIEVDKNQDLPREALLYKIDQLEFQNQQSQLKIKHLEYQQKRSQTKLDSFIERQTKIIYSQLDNTTKPIRFSNLLVSSSFADSIQQTTIIKEHINYGLPPVLTLPISSDRQYYELRILSEVQNKQQRGGKLHTAIQQTDLPIVKINHIKEKDALGITESKESVYPIEIARIHENKITIEVSQQQFSYSLEDFLYTMRKRESNINPNSNSIPQIQQANNIYINQSSESFINATKKRIDILLKIAQSIKAVHNNGIFLGSINPRKIYIDQQTNTFIFSFVKRSELEERKEPLEDLFSESYLSPNQILNIKSELSVEPVLDDDIWAFGNVAHYTFTGNQLFAIQNTVKEIILNYKTNSYFNIWNETKKSFKIQKENQNVQRRWSILQKIPNIIIATFIDRLLILQEDQSQLKKFKDFQEIVNDLEQIKSSFNLESNSALGDKKI